MISILFITLYTFSIGYISFGFHVLLKDRHSAMYRKFFYVSISSFLWAMGYALMYISPDVHAANYWRILALAGWGSFPSVCLDFFILVCYKKRKLNKFLKTILYIPPFVFFFYYSSFSYEKVIFKISGGWCDIYSGGSFDFLLCLYYVISMVACLFMLYRLGKKARFTREKNQAKTFFYPAVIAFALGLTTDIILPALGYDVYPYAIFFLSILMAGVWYAITKYKMMVISPEYMSDYIFKSVSNPIFLLDENLNIIKANAAALKLIGFKFEEVYETSIKALFGGKTVDYYGLYERGSITNTEISLQVKTGESVSCILSGTVVYDRYDDILGIVVILQDISDRKKVEGILWNYNYELERKIKERTTELELANNAKSDFLANVSHELRTPLNVIHSASQLFNMYLRDENIYNKENASRHLASIKQNCLRLIRLVNNILDTTKLDGKHFELHIQNYNIVEVVGRIVDSVRDYISQRGITLEFITDMDTRVTAIDINAIERVVLNLISNAIKFTKEKGHIIIKVTEVEGRVILSVKDDGAGIPEELHKEIFERFKQANNLLTREHEGSGLGLAITKTLVQMHNGKIYVKSKPDQGSEFIVELPIKVIDAKVEDAKLDNSGQNLIERINVEFSDIYD